MKHQTSPAMPCFPHSSLLFQETKAACVYPHPHRTVTKPWASVPTSKAALAAVLEMEPDNFGYEWLVCSWGWNYGWRRVRSPACSEGTALEKRVSLQCSALVVRPPLRDPVPVIAGLLHRGSLKRCQLLPTVMGVFVLCLLVIEIRETCGIWFSGERKEEMCMLHYTTHLCKDCVHLSRTSIWPSLTGTCNHIFRFAVR